jgi:hypothetical protein
MMNGDYTRVPLRRDERWTGARMQQGRVLLDHDWNLNLDAAARTDQAVARDAIGAAGVVAGSDAFAIGVTGTGVLDLTVGAGRMWVDGVAAFAPEPFPFSGQDQIEPLPETGRVFVYLDVFCEHVQPAENPLELVDPALAPSDTTGRTRVGYRVRATATTAASCGAAWAALTTVPESDGTLTVERAGPLAPEDPCSPPGEPLAQLPDGLLRVEVLDGGSEATARFAWSFEDGAVAVPVASIAGDTVTLAPAELGFAAGEQVEVSWLARRADRLPHGELYTIASVTPGAAGDVLTLDRPVTAPAAAAGLALRRWDGEAVGAASATDADYKGADLGIRFTAAAGGYEAGDWWGARLRAEAGDGLEHRVAAAPDGVRHAFAPLALVDLDARAVLSDCRPRFTPLADLGGACTVSVKPGDDLQAAVERLPADGGELCFAAGTYVVDPPLRVSGRRRVVLAGAGPATVLRAARREAAVAFDGCSEVEVRRLRAEGGAAGDPPGDPGLDGALTFLACRDIVVADCVLACPDSDGKVQTCVAVRRGEGAPDRVRIERNRVEVGAGQTGILVADAARATVAGNHVVLAPGGGGGFLGGSLAVGAELRAVLGASLRPRRGAGIKRVAIPGVDEALLVEGEEPAALAADFAAAARPSSVARAGGAEKALLRFARSLGTGKGVEALSPASRDFVSRLATLLRSAGQGIVVGGSSATTVRVLDNLVEGAIQGIHVGVSEREGGRRSIDSVLVAGNVVHALVPASYDRDRHGVFVGNVRSLHVVDTVATLGRIPPEGVPAPTPVEGVRVHGTLGPFVAIRQTSLRGFSTGVRVVPLAPEPTTRMWLVAETLAEGATAALVAPAVVDRERNVP